MKRDLGGRMKEFYEYCRTVWNCVDSPLFTIDKNFLNSRVPDI